MSLYNELKRRNVFRVAIAYLALAWLLTEVAGTLFPGFGIPDWAFRFVVIVLALGFVPVLIFSWAYEITPEGLKREKEVVRDESVTHLTAKRLDTLTIGLIVVALAFVVVDRVWISQRLTRQPAVVAELAQPKTVAAEVGPASAPNSIAVLPFANRSNREEDQFFTDGIHDDLLTTIARIGSMKVISRTSVMEYKDTTKKIPEIAAELGVANILEGGVQRAGQQVRINVQLIDAQTDEHLWAEIFDRELTATNIFTIQSEIAGSIAEALRATLTPETRERVASVPTENLEALEAYFLGRQSMAKRTIPDLIKAAEKFEKAVELDPGFALAWVGLADTYLLRWGYLAEVTRSEAFAKNRYATEKALRLDPGLGEAYASEGKRRNWEGDHEGAEAAFKKALQLNPNYAPAYQWYGEMLRDLNGRIDEALEMSRKAVELDPLAPIIHRDFGIVLSRASRFDEALAQYQKAIEINPGFAPALVQIGFHYWGAFGRVDKAVHHLNRNVSINPDAHTSMRFIAMAYLDLGDAGQAEDWLHRALEMRDDDYRHNYSALLHLYRGEEATAMEFAEKALATGTRSPLYWWMMLALLGDRDMKAGNHSQARARYEQSHPELFNESGPEIDRFNIREAIGLAAMFLKNGEAQRAEQLLDRCLSVISELPRLSEYGYGISDVQVYALRGEREKALAALRQAVDQGWRMNWWFHLEHDPNLQLLRDEPAFQEIKAEIEADMAEQLARLSEWEASGELPLVPNQ